MKAWMRTMFLLLALVTVCVAAVGCAGDTPAGTDAETTAPVDVGPVSELPPTEANILEAWNLSEGGRDDVFRSAAGGADGIIRWGTWLPTDTFGFTLDFSVEGSYAKAEATKTETLTDSFSMAAWVKAPPRNPDRRVILSQGIYDPTAPVLYDNETVVREFTVNEGWSRLNGKIRGCEFEGANGGRCIEITGTDEPLIAALQFKNEDYSAYVNEDGYLHAHIWVENASALVGGELELTSSHTSDQNEATFQLTPQQFHDGWNDLYLPVEKAVENSDVDFSAINFIRVFMYVTGTQTIRYDTLTLCSVSEQSKAEDFALYLNEENGELCFDGAGLTGLAPSGVSLDDGSWHHVQVVLDHGIFTYYVDGAAVKSMEVSGSLVTTTGDVTIGAAPDANDGFNGSLSQVRIFSGAILPNAVTNITVAEADNTFGDLHMPISKGIWVAGDNIQDIINCRDMGFDHARVGFDPETAAMVYINDDGTLTMDSVRQFETQVNNFVRADMPVIIGPHPTQVFKDKWITDQSRFERLVSWYGDLAAYMAERFTPDQIAFTIMSEPAGGPADVSWNWIADRIVSAIRNAAPEYTILTGGDACANIEHTKAMEPMTDDNLAYEISTYEPYTIGFGTATSGMGGTVTFWNYLGAVPYPVPEGLTDEEVEEIVRDTTSLEPAEFKAQAQEVVRNYLKGISDSAYPNNYGGVYNRDWHLRRWQSVTDWAERYGGAHVNLSECGTIDAVQSIQYYGAVEGSGATMESHYAHLRDIVETALDAGFSIEYCCYNNAELTVFDTRLRTRYGGGLSSDLALSWYDYDKIAALHITPVREYHPSADLKDARLAIPFADEEDAAEAASELLLGFTAPYGTVKTVADPVRGRAASFDGGEGSTLMAENTAIKLTKDGMAVSAWVKPDKAASGEVQYLVSQTEDLSVSEDGVVGKYTMADCEDATGWWGISPIATMERESPDGEYALVTTAPDTVIFCKVFSPILNIGAFLQGGYLSMDIYMDNAAAVTSVRVELGSSGDPVDSVAIDAHGPFHDGWNTVVFNVDDITYQGNVDTTAINYFRFVGYCIGSTTTMALDHFFAGLIPGEGSAYNYWTLLLDEEGRLQLTSDKLSATAPSDSALPDDGDWHHVMASYDGTAVTYYIDGEASGSFEATGIPTAPSTSDTFFGGGNNGGQRYAGLLSAARIYAAPKTPADVTPAE